MSLFLFLLATYVCARHFAVTSVDAAFELFDAFSLSTIPFPLAAKPGIPLAFKNRSIGGIFSILGGITFLTITLVLVLQREADNVSRQESIVTLTDARRTAALELPVFSTSAASWDSGIQVRLTASGDGDVCFSEMQWAATEASDWNLTATPLCGERDGSVSQLVFNCPDCSKLLPTSSLSVTLPYSCQSLLIEAAAMDATGVVSSFTLPYKETLAAPGEIITNVSWSLSTLFSVVNSSVGSSSSTRGFTLTELSHTIVSQKLKRVDSGLALNPLSKVTVVIAFPLNTFYSLTMLSEKQSITALLASIVGLLGVINFFKSLLNSSDWVQQLRARQSKDTPVKDTSAQSADNFDMTNPLHNDADGKKQRKQLRSASVPPPPNSSRQRFTVARLANDISRLRRFTQYVDEYDVWFHCVETGETTWSLPDGAVCDTIVDVESTALPHSRMRRASSELPRDDAPFDLPRSARVSRGLPVPPFAPTEQSPSSISQLADSIAREHFNSAGEDDAHTNLRATARAIMVTDMSGKETPQSN